MAFFEQGSRVWVRDGDLWCAATAASNDGTVSTFTKDDGSSVSLENATISPETATAMHETSVNGVEDMAQLADLHEGSLLYNIALRYRSDQIYTYIGSILSAVNPYKKLDSLYGAAKIDEYNGQTIGDLPPHIYAIANEAYHAVWKTEQNQAVLISGESGAGKTESTKFILNFLSHLSNAVHASKGNTALKNYEQQIVESSPILESFGNAKTVYNNNSSRFGKFIQLHFGQGGAIEGAKILDYLLEKNRVVRQNAAERNFHVFYGLLSSPKAAAYGLSGNPADYHYTAQSGVWQAEGIDDKEFWAGVESSFETMGFAEDQQKDVLTMLAAILHLGNMKFSNAGGAQIASPQPLASTANLLGLEESAMAELLTQQKRVLRGEEIFTPLEIDQAEDSRDSLAMAIYSRLFKWVITKLNMSLRGQESFKFIGVLDIFGFENFECNSFEQFNINYANEKLQQYFNRHIFSLEQLEYNKEGIDWSDIDWVDNAECLNLIERKLGVLSLLDEESRFPKGTDESLLGKLHSSHGSSGDSGHYVRPRVTNDLFGIRHFAGEVMYNIRGFLNKNRDTFREDVSQALQESSSDFVFDLFEERAVNQGRSTARKKPTVSFQFKESLLHLMTTLGQAAPFFVRCLKPNVNKVPDTFQDQVVLNQLRYSGMLETVRIRRAGYPVRREFDNFVFRYRVLGTGVDKSQPTQDVCAAILKLYDETTKDWQIGKTKVFMRERLEHALEKSRHTKLKATVDRIQAVIMGYVQRKRYLATRAALIKMQAFAKAMVFRMRYQKKRNAAITIQSGFRGLKARQLRAQLAEEKRLKEERRLAEEKRLEEERLAELARLEAEAKAAAELEAREREEAERRLDEARKAAEEEARRKAEEEVRKAAEQEERRKKEMARARELEEEQKRKEEEARQKAEEAKRLAEEAARLKEIEERARAAEEAERQRQDVLARERAEADRLAALEEEMEESDEPEPVEHKEGYMGLFSGVLKNLRKRWCVFHDGLFMWFKGQQNFIHAGWLTKMGGGTRTIGRKSWKRRWMALRGGTLHYYPSDEEGSEQLGVVDIQNCKTVTTEDVPVKKDNCFMIECPDRTYFMYSETPEECEEWVSILNMVKGKTTEEINEMLAQASVHPKHAEGTLDQDEILSAGPTNTVDVEGHPSFVVMTSDRVYKFVAQSDAELEDWCRILTPKRHVDAADADGHVIERGWMLKAGGKDGNYVKRRRWFVLKGDAISYYKNKDDLPIGTIPLNSLTSVIPPDEDKLQKNDYTFIVHSRIKSFHLTCKTQTDCNRWINAIQDVIDSCPVIQTPMERLIDELRMASASETDQIYQSHKVLTYSSVPLPAPMLPLPYGKVESPSGSRAYESLNSEALKISAALLPSAAESRNPYGSPSNPVQLIKNILQVCFDVHRLRNEVYCQVVSQTTNAPNPGSALNMTHWHLLACLCCSFAPARKFQRFVRYHLSRTVSMKDHVGAQVAEMAAFCLESLKHNKVARDFPPSTHEIEAIMSGKGLHCTVQAVGGRTIDLPVTSSTTCGDVIAAVKQELHLENCRNGFGLFEACGGVTKYLEEKHTIADVLSKWEKYQDHGINPDGGSWAFQFKLFSFYEPRAADLTKTEKEFLFEQAFEAVMARKFPADDNMQIRLAALRTQFVVGDWEEGAYISDVVKVHPAQQPQLLAPDQGGVSGTLKKAGTMIKGTLKGLGKGTLRRLRGGTMKKTGEVTDAEMQKIKDRIVKEWKKLQGMSQDDAREAFMQIIQTWEGYGCNLFEVTQTLRKEWPKELWLGISLEGVSIFPKNQRERLAFFRYETVLSFGAPVSNKYKIVVDGSGAMLFETNMVLEIAKLMKEYIKTIVSRSR
eukprot:m.353252 g.353252  ORF g.353252 m.353252 type:complete len:1850 (+) comp16718_c0_seq1:158-5707(+)